MAKELAHDVSGTKQNWLDRGWRPALVAFAIYCFISWLFIGRGVSLTQNIIGRDSASYAFMWFIAWLPWAVSHHLNPLWTHMVWQPAGVPMPWMAFIPLVAALAAPVTMTAGPVVSFNVFVVAAPVLSAWCMYRFCSRLTSSPAAAIIGGYIFGFSTYEMMQVPRLNLSFTFLLPCIAGIVLSRLQQHTGRGHAVFWLSICLACQFLISTEITAICSIFSGISWLLAFLLISSARAALVRVLIDIAAAAPCALILTSPLLVVMFSRYPFIALPPLWPKVFSASPTDFFIPGQFSFFSLPLFWRLTNGFTDEFEEQNAYMGLPLLLILYGYGRSHWHLEPVRFLITALLVMMVLSLGPFLWIGEKLTKIPMPWTVFTKLPLLSNALPIRFSLYISFLSAIIVTLWLAEARPGRHLRQRFAAALLACLVIMPVHYPYIPVPESPFFEPGRVESVLGNHPQLLIMPFGSSGASTYWQLENGFGFTQTGGYLGFPPLAMEHFGAVDELTERNAVLSATDIMDFAQQTHAGFVVLGPGARRDERLIMLSTGWARRDLDDVTIYTVPRAVGGAGPG